MYLVFSLDVTATILVSLNYETTAMLVAQTNLEEVGLPNMGCMGMCSPKGSNFLPFWRNGVSIRGSGLYTPTQFFWEYIPRPLASGYIQLITHSCFFSSLSSFSFYIYHLIFLYSSLDLQNIERERYRDQLRRINIDLGRHNSTSLEEESERYKNETTEPLSEKWNTTEVLNTL